MFAHLHTHTEFSLLDGMSKIEPLVQRAKALGQDALAITDHGAMYGAIDFYETARKHGVKPIIGIEAYVAPGSRFDKDPKNRWPHHLTLLAENETGYRNLLKLSSAAHLEGFYYRPRMDKELLAAHSEGLIALSGCPSGEFMSALREDDEQKAMEVAGWYSDVFKGRYYLETMEHGIEKFTPLMPRVFDLAKRLDLPSVVTNDSHYTSPEDVRAHEVLLCIGSNSTVHDEGRFKLDGDTFYLRSEEEMRSLFPDHPEAADHTWEIAERVNIELQFGRTQLPNPGIPDGVTARDHLRALCEEGLQRRYASDVTDTHVERLRYELDVVAQTGFDEYMLIVRDIALYAKANGIRTGVRGSAASSIILYTLDVTDIDPLAFGLVFERFLNPERISMPDVDFDFADDRREEIIRYTVEKYGRDRVAQICTFGTLGAKAAIRDTGRALGMDFGAADRIARMVPDSLHITLADALKQAPELQQAYESDPQIRELVDTAQALEGVARHSSTHAAGVVISSEPLTDVVPLQRATSKDADSETAVPTTQYTMGDIDKIGLLKIDYLGLTNLTILEKALDLIEERRGERVDLLLIPDGDPATADVLGNGDTFGVFQMESAGMRRYVMELKPQNVRELSAMVALFRPGPMEQIPRFIDVKHGRAEAFYAHEDLRPILEETYGVISYQEQVLQIARTFAGYTLGQADVMRKAMGKKIASVMVEERERFLAGLVAQGYEEQLGRYLFDLIEPFAGYAFNKAHAVCYGTIAYQTAYLKAHYPAEYMAAVLQAANGNSDRIAAAIAECNRLGIPVLQPDVNRSEANFAIELAPDGIESIRFGLAQIKNVGLGGVEGLIAERVAKGDFETVEDFARRINARDVNKRVIESLAKAGALDSLGDRGAVISGVDRLLSLAQQEQRLRETGQTSMFDMFGDEVNTPLPALELDDVRIPQPQLLAWEKELLGTYISEHPFSAAAKYLSQYTTHQAAEVGSDLAGQDAIVAGLIVGVRPLATKQGKAFAAVLIEDLSGQAEVMIWTDAYERFKQAGLLFEGNILLFKVNVRARGDRVSAGVFEACAYDQDAQRLSADFQPGKFQVRSASGGAAGYGGYGGYAPRPAAAAAIREPQPPPYRPGGPGGPGGPSGPSADRTTSNDRAEAGDRRHLQVVEASADEAAPDASEARDAGPRRLVVEMEETTDDAADLRRLRRLCAVLDEFEGDLPVEIVVKQRSGHLARLQRGGVNPSAVERIIPRLKALLGVLGEARETGAGDALDARARDLAAVGG
ncbi:MAG: DNA polymerase III subunit alpha [Dehalococcoidia bacterium]